MSTPSKIPSETQVIVIGGGPAGSTASTLLAQKGIKVELFEREKFPRFHIGESLIPETYWVLKRLNMIEKMKKSAFTVKESVQFVNAKGQLSEPFYFTQHKPGEQSSTWQVLRSEFDNMMLNNAREHGVNVHEEIRVLDVLFDGTKATGVRLIDETGEVREVRAELVIDASGQSSMISSKFKLREWDQDLKKGAVWTYWKGAHRDEGIDAGATIVVQTLNKEGWFWYIPLHNDVLSIGVVSSFDYLFNKSRGTHEEIFKQELDNCPHAKQRLSIGERCNQYFATKDYSYRSTKVAGERWMLVGDAYGFLDPLYSSGVLLALKSAQLAADCVVEAFAKNDFSEAQLGKWGPNFRKGMDRMRRLVCEYYDGFSFGRFVKKNPQLKGHLTDMLIGDLFDDHVEELMGPLDEARQEINESRKQRATAAV